MVCRGFAACAAHASPTCPGDRRKRCLLSRDARSTVVLEENHKRYELRNEDRDEVARYRVDDGVIQGAQMCRCDGLVIAHGARICIFVELKGKDVAHAVQQIGDTLDALGDSLADHAIHARIISRTFPRVEGADILKLRKRVLRMNASNTARIHINECRETLRGHKLDT